MEKIGKSVEHALSRTGGGTALALAEITAAWPAAVGKAVSREAWPLRVGRDGTLHVATSSSTWAFELDRLSPEIEERLRTLAGPAAPTKLRFRVGPVPEHGGLSEGEAGVPGEALVVTSQVDSEAASLASEIEDPELRALVARAARASLARARSGRHF
jgi:Dna[CI] antecedent, DciA